jgi:hypothetical protein
VTVPVQRRRSLLPVLAIALVLGVLGAGAFLQVASTGCGLPEDPACTKVLFIGNSYTSVNDLPRTFAALARSGGLHADTAMIAPGGAFLADHAANPDVAAAIGSRRWTAVVLRSRASCRQSPAPSRPASFPRPSRS